MAAGQLPSINTSLIPPPVTGFSDVRIRATGERGYRDPDGTGAFRTVCDYSHMNFDDAIVFPGRPGVSHLHVYFGNTEVHAATTVVSLIEKGNSTCRGGIANRSAYWVPAMIDTRNGAPQRPRTANIYYKTGYQGSSQHAIVAPPLGLRIVAGDSKSSVVQWVNGQKHITYSCDDVTFSDTIPKCVPGQELEMHVRFPQCWDGVNLDSPDHQSHMAYGRWGIGCPASHPVSIPEISIIALTPVLEQDTSTWRLSSDRNGAAAGTSGHADWMNGWHKTPDGEYLPDVFVQRLLKAGLSGGSHMIGDGRVMY